MPRPASLTGADGLPLWDTFEASFFLVAGLFVGVVLGFLFPSLWRTLRRRFRNTARFAPEANTLGQPITAPVRLLPEDDLEQTETSTTTDLTISQAFVFARSMIQQGRAREAVQTYLEILAFEQVTKKETNRALYELSQTYAELGLSSRAIETGMELLHRKPELVAVFEHVMKLCVRFGEFSRLKDVLQTFKGQLTPPQRMVVAHAFAEAGENQLASTHRKEALEFARLAARYFGVSARAKILLWQVTSLDLWERSAKEPSSLWLALAADLEARAQIARETQISPAAGADYLAECLGNLATAHAVRPVREVFQKIQSEFLKVSGRGRMDLIESEKNEWIIVYAALRFLNDPVFWESQSLRDIVEVLAPNAWPRAVGQEHHLSLRTAVLADGLKIQSCAHCHSIVAQFSWMCQVCGALESMRTRVEP